MNRCRKSILYILVLTVFAALRIFSLGSDISNSDALRWHNRSENFLNGLKQRDFAETYQRYHPGVTLMWIGAVSSQLLLWHQQAFSDEVMTYGNADFYPTAHGVSKMLVVFVLFACFVFQLYLIRKLLGDRTALIYGFFIAVEPYLVGINRWFHLSSLEAFFAFTSLLSVLVFFKNKRNIFLIVSAVFAALGVLSKMTVLITVSYIAILLIMGCVKKNIKLKHLLIYLLIFVSSFFAFFPALWVDFYGVVSKMYSALFNAVLLDPRGELLTFYAKVFYYPLIFIFKTSPLLLAGTIYYFVRRLRRGEIIERLIFLYFVFISVALSLADQKIDRYVLALFLPMILLVSNTIANLGKKYINIIIALQIVFFIYISYCYYPVYSAYINPLVGYKQVLKWGFYENSGEYYAHAARYINQKGRDINVYIPNNIDSFKPYYKGKITDDVAAADYIVFGLDFDRKSFPLFTGCRIEKYFGNKIYSPLAVYTCSSANLSFVKTPEIY